MFATLLGLAVLLEILTGFLTAVIQDHRSSLEIWGRRVVRSGLQQLHHAGRGAAVR